MSDETGNPIRHLKPDLYAEITMNDTPTRPRYPGWRLPCVPADNLDRQPLEGWGAIPLLEEPINPGETRTVGLAFLTQEGAQAIREAGTFYLWEGRVVAKAVVLPGYDPESEASSEDAPATPSP